MFIVRDQTIEITLQLVFQSSSDHFGGKITLNKLSNYFSFYQTALLVEEGCLHIMFTCQFNKRFLTTPYPENILSHVVETITDNMNRRHHMASVFLDIRHPFNRVWQVKLIRIRFSGNLSKYIQLFLSDLSFEVRMGWELCGTQPIAAGVPKGSTVSPSIFFLQISSATHGS